VKFACGVPSISPPRAEKMGAMLIEVNCDRELISISKIKIQKQEAGE
jgi:hypothetical protein